MHLFNKLFNPILLVYAAAATGILFVVVSLLGSVVGSFTEGSAVGSFTLSNYLEIATSSHVVRVTASTLALGAGSVLAMMLFALPIAWLMVRSDIPLKRLWLSLLVAQLGVPGFIVAMSYVWLFNPTSGIVNLMLGTAGSTGLKPLFNVYSIGWICFLQGVSLAPGCVFMVLPAFRNLGSSLEEAARVSGVKPLRTFFRIIVPLLAPSILAATLFFFVVSIEIFDFVGLIGMPARLEVLSLWIYEALHPAFGLPEYGRASAYGMVLFALASLAILVYARLLGNAKKFAVITGKSQAARLVRLGNWTWAAVSFIGLWVVLAFVVPLLSLFWVASTPFLQPPSRAAFAQTSLRGFVEALSYLPTPLLNTAIVVVITVVLAIVWSVAISWVVVRSGSRMARWVDSGVFLSLAVPSMVSAVAFQFLAMAGHKWVPLYGTTLLIALALGTRLLAFCTRTINGPALQIHPELDEVAYVSGISRFRAFRRVFLPLIMPAVAFSAIVSAILAARELTLPLMMNTGKAPVVATLIFDLQSAGSYNVAAAVGIYMIFAFLILVSVVFIVQARYQPERAGASQRPWGKAVPGRRVLA